MTNWYWYSVQYPQQENPKKLCIPKLVHMRAVCAMQMRTNEESCSKWLNWCVFDARHRSQLNALHTHDCASIINDYRNQRIKYTASRCRRSMCIEEEGTGSQSKKRTVRLWTTKNNKARQRERTTYKFEYTRIWILNCATCWWIYGNHAYQRFVYMPNQSSVDWYAFSGWWKTLPFQLAISP